MARPPHRSRLDPARRRPSPSAWRWSGDLGDIDPRGRPGGWPRPRGGRRGRTAQKVGARGGLGRGGTERRSSRKVRVEVNGGWPRRSPGRPEHDRSRSTRHHPVRADRLTAQQAGPGRHHRSDPRAARRADCARRTGVFPAGARLGTEGLLYDQRRDLAHGWTTPAGCAEDLLRRNGALGGPPPPLREGVDLEDGPRRLARVANPRPRERQSRRDP